MNQVYHQDNNIYRGAHFWALETSSPLRYLEHLAKVMKWALDSRRIFFNGIPNKQQKDLGRDFYTLDGTHSEMELIQRLRTGFSTYPISLEDTIFHSTLCILSNTVGVTRVLT
jgi:hypothetical protein